MVGALGLGAWWFISNMKSFTGGGGPVMSGEPTEPAPTCQVGQASTTVSSHCTPVKSAPTPTIDSILGLSSQEACTGNSSKRDDTSIWEWCKCSKIGKVTFVYCKRKAGSGGATCLQSNCSTTLVSSKARKTMKIDKCKCTKHARGELRSMIESEIKAGGKLSAAFARAYRTTTRTWPSYSYATTMMMARPYKVRGGERAEE